MVETTRVDGPGQASTIAPNTMVRTPDTSLSNYDAPLLYGWADFLGCLTFPAHASIVIRTDASVDVFSDNTSHRAVLPPTTPPQRPRAMQRRRKGSRHAAAASMYRRITPAYG